MASKRSMYGVYLYTFDGRHQVLVHNLCVKKRVLKTTLQHTVTHNECNNIQVNSRFSFDVIVLIVFFSPLIVTHHIIDVKKTIFLMEILISYC